MKNLTKSDIFAKVENLKALTGENGLKAEFAAVYGGWRLIKVDAKTGGHSGVFGLSDCAVRMSTGEFYQLLKGIEIGLTIK